MGSERVTLTKTYVDKLAPPAAGYTIYWDDKLPGFGLRITASGVKSFIRLVPADNHMITKIL